MWTVKFCLPALIACATCLADDHADREKLWGTWTAHDSSITLRSNGRTVQVSETQGPGKVAEFECNTMGKECKVNTSGRESTLTMYFNGPRLIELETTGKEVVKRRFRASSDGKQLEVEVMSIVPERKAEILMFQRAPETTAKDTAQ